MLLRALALLICLSATGWYLIGEQQAGRFQRVDELFLDFLIANARATLEQPAPGADPEVVLVRLREEDADEFAAWPPPPIDWHTVIKSLQPYQPEVVLIAHPLSWGQPGPDFLPALSEALAPLPAVVMAVEAHAAEPDATAPPFMGNLGETLPRFQRLEGAPRVAPALGALIAAPDDVLRRHGQLGLTAWRVDADGTWRLPYAMREGPTLIPSAFAQTLALYSRTPYASHRLRLGPGAGAQLRDGLFVPLQPNGEVVVPPSARGNTTAVNGLDLMTGTLTDGVTDDVKAKLARARIVVIGLDHDNAAAAPSVALLHAAALSQVLALPRIRVLTQWQQWIAWGAAAGAAFVIVLAVRKQKALLAGLGFTFAALVASFLAFQAALLWCPPTIPAALIGVGALVGRIFGKGRKVKAEAEPVHA